MAELPWRIREVDDAVVSRLASDLGVRELTARCLVGRGITELDAARAFLEPRLAALRPPDGLAGLDAAVDRLASAIDRGERIGVFGDYDADGITTAALMTSFLRGLRVPCIPRVAKRDAGYGFGVADVQFFVERECSLIITGDCGTSDVVAIDAAAERGVDVVVVDHHTVPDRDAPHPAVALVNPFRADSTFPFRGMASVGLAFYMMVALRTRLRADGFFRGRVEPDVRDLLDLVAIGTVADLVPLTDENRVLTGQGIERLRRRQRPGLDALARTSGVDSSRPIDEKTIGWKLAPRLNAPGRLGDAEPALALVLADDVAAAEARARQLEQVNDDRRAAQARVLEEALEQLGDTEPGPAVIACGRGWQSGVVGIVAAKLAERYRRPAFVIAVDPETGLGRGSGRSWGGVNLYAALNRCGSLMERFGGHAAAAGLTVSADRVGELCVALARAVGEQKADVSSDSVADAEVGLGDVDQHMVEELQRLAPFGKQNERPVLICRGARVTDSRCVGDGSHLKLTLEDRNGNRRSAIAFGLGSQDPGVGAIIDAVFAPVISVWAGQRRVELEVRALRLAEPAAALAEPAVGSGLASAGDPG